MDKEKRRRRAYEAIQGINQDGTPTERVGNLKEYDLQPYQSPYKKKYPTRFAGNPYAEEWSVPINPEVGGFVTPEFESNHLLMNRMSSGKNPELVELHENEHLLQKRGLGNTMALGRKWDELVGDDGKTRKTFVNDSIKAQKHLVENYGLNPDELYFHPEFLNRTNYPEVFLHEQLATLSALEQMTGKDMTQDPVLRKTLFKDQAVRETFRAVTGLRQTRLDSKDLRPYTRIKEKAK